MSFVDPIEGRKMGVIELPLREAAPPGKGRTSAIATKGLTPIGIQKGQMEICTCTTRAHEQHAIGPDAMAAIAPMGHGLGVWHPTFVFLASEVDRHEVVPGRIELYKLHLLQVTVDGSCTAKVTHWIPVS